MSNTKQIIITLNAKSLFDYFPKKPAENDQCFKLDFSDPVHSYVVTQEITREDCPLFHQIYEVLKKRQGSSFQVTETKRSGISSERCAGSDRAWV